MLLAAHRTGNADAVVVSGHAAAVVVKLVTLYAVVVTLVTLYAVVVTLCVARWS